MADSTEHREGSPIPHSSKTDANKIRNAFRCKYSDLWTDVYQNNQEYTCTMDGCASTAPRSLEKLRKHYQGLTHRNRLNLLTPDERAIEYVALEISGWLRVNGTRYGYDPSKISLDLHGKIISGQASNVGNSSHTSALPLPAAPAGENQASHRLHGTHGTHGYDNSGIQGVDRGVYGPSAAQPQTAPLHSIHRSDYPTATIPAILHVHGLKPYGTESSVRPYVSPYDDPSVGSTASTGRAGSSIQAAPHIPVRGIPAVEQSRDWGRQNHQGSIPYISPYADPVVESTASTGHAGSSVHAPPHLPVRGYSAVELLHSQSRHTQRSSSPHVSSYADPVVASTGHAGSHSATTGSQGAAGRGHDHGHGRRHREEGQGRDSRAEQEHPDPTAQAREHIAHLRLWF